MKKHYGYVSSFSRNIKGTGRKTRIYYRTSTLLPGIGNEGQIPQTPGIYDALVLFVVGAHFKIKGYIC
jgi:hypothetical protein